MDSRLKLFETQYSQKSLLEDKFPNSYLLKNQDSLVVALPFETSTGTIRKLVQDLSLFEKRPRQVAITSSMFLEIFASVLRNNGTVGEVTFSTEISSEFLQPFRNALLSAENGNALCEREIENMISREFYAIIDEYDCYVKYAVVHFGSGFNSVRVHISDNGILTFPERLSRDKITPYLTELLTVK